MHFILVLIFVAGTAYSQEEGRTCARLREKCIATEDCCIGTCVAGHCNDGLFKNNRDRTASGGDVSTLIAAELSPGTNMDVSEHENIRFLATLDECGDSYTGHHRQKRIVGGTTYELGKYPFLVSLHVTDVNNKTSYMHCGGSLIGRRHILTAAHCVTRLSSGIMLKYVTLGNVDRRIKLGCEENRTAEGCRRMQYVDAEVDSWIVHEGYSESTVRHDIALIKLKQDVNYTDYIKPICLPRNERILKGWQDGKFTVAGWGDQNDPTDHSPPKLSLTAKEVEITLVHRSNCDRFFTRMIGKLRRSQICVGGYPGKADCGGDSGGPMFKKVQQDEGGESAQEKFFLFGLVSTGATSNCAREGKPSVFTSVAFFMPWILENLGRKRDAVRETVVRTHTNPVEEFATGFNPPMDVTKHPNLNILPQFPNCGIINGQQDHEGPGHHAHIRRKRLVGGLLQSVGAFPYMVQIYARNVVTAKLAFRCGGVLISPRHVLTGAHCVADIRGNYVLDGVLLGNFNRKEKTECIGEECITQKIIPIQELIGHEGFTKFARENDVALIKLSYDVKFNRFVQPICLPLREDFIRQAWPDPQNDRRYVAAGWGRVSPTSDEQEMSQLLIGANFTLENKKYCESVLVRKVGKLENSRVCGGPPVPERGECVGDTGGPMMRWITLKGADGRQHTRMFALGIMSVVECAHQGIPTLYQNLIYHMPWIMDHLSD